MQPAIRVDDLGKRYRVCRTHSAKDYRTLRESLVAAAATPFRRLAGRRDEAPDEDFWALQGVSFEVQPGEVVGIIGNNGAGKSTLLRVLSRITRPTTGRVELRGRVGSLLEVGTGFHPELTGRENVFLNGSILGMARREIARRFDEIVAFAEVERFLDMPVKRYSSGMYVRLAFAVAAFLEPEILLVDEVLAVGDAAFQSKCLGKMNEVSRSGRTVFFVSHNMASIAELCGLGLHLERGQIVGVGPAVERVAAYLSSLRKSGATPLAARVDRSGTGDVRLTALEFRDAAGRPVGHIHSGDGLTLDLGFEARGEPAELFASVSIINELGTPIATLANVYTNDKLLGPSRSGRLACSIESLPLAPGRYLFHVDLKADGRFADQVAGAGELEILSGAFFASGITPPASLGSFLCRHRWALEGARGDA